MVDALEVWKELSCQVRGVEDFFLRKCEHADLGKGILERGSTDFDTKYAPDDPDEKPTYKTDLYIRIYMDMHIKQNRTVLEKYLGRTLRNRMHIVFVDFGCGPMTSGLVLAEILSRHDEDYEKKFIYLGIDASQNMVERAKRINEQHKIFAPDRFGIVQGKTFDFSDSVVEKTLGSTTQVDLAVSVCPLFWHQKQIGFFLKANNSLGQEISPKNGINGYRDCRTCMRRRSYTLIHADLSFTPCGRNSRKHWNREWTVPFPMNLGGENLSPYQV